MGSFYCFDKNVSTLLNALHKLAMLLCNHNHSSTALANLWIMVIKMIEIPVLENLASGRISKWNEPHRVLSNHVERLSSD